MKKLVAILSLCLMLAPVLALAAGFTIPDAGNTGLPNQNNATSLIMYIINIVLGISGLIAVLFLLIGGFRYITSAGNEEVAEQAKKIIINAIIGIVIIILSFVIVRVIAQALINQQT
jgi:hypothetical protein